MSATASTICETRRGSCGSACVGGEVSAFTNDGGRRMVFPPMTVADAADAGEEREILAQEAV